MKVWELINTLESLPPDEKIDVLHVCRDAKTRVYAVVNVSEDLMGAHLIVESKRKLMADAEREDDHGRN